MKPDYKDEKTDGREIRPEENIGLVHMCVKRFVGKGIEYDDLFQAGCVGLVEAANKFDFDRGVNFSTYAVPVILGEIRKLFRNSGAVKVSRGLRELSQRARETAEELRGDSGRYPSVSEVAEKLDISLEKAVLALEASSSAISLSGFGGNDSLEIPVDAPEEKLTEKITLREIISSLPEKDRKLIISRYYEHKTQAETAERLGMTQVQVSRREKKLLLLMRSLLI